jgi:predicted transposase YbfD/YdcC
LKAVADALHCQKETAALIVEKQADYLLNVKDKHPTLKNDLEEYVQDGDLRKSMDVFETIEKNGGRIEKRTGFVILIGFLIKTAGRTFRALVQ